MREFKTIQALKEEGYKIFRMHINRLYNLGLIGKFSAHLNDGGEIIEPGYLVTARVMFKYGRKIVDDSGKTYSPDMLKPGEKKQVEDGKWLVVLDGSHRYTSILDNLETCKTEKNRKELREKMVFQINKNDLSESELNRIFFDLNTMKNMIDTQDYIPYIIMTHGSTGEYSYDCALNSCILAGYKGDSKRNGLFDFPTARLICSGGYTPNAYRDNKSTLNIVLNGKGKIKDDTVKNSEAFEKYILIPYVFEKTLEHVYLKGKSNMNNGEKGLIYQNKQSLITNLFNVIRDPRFELYLEHLNVEGDKKLVAFVYDCISSHDILKQYKDFKTIRRMGELYGYSAIAQRYDFIFNLVKDWGKTTTSEKIESTWSMIKAEFDSKVNEMVEKEKQYLEHLDMKNPSSRGAYMTNHKKLVEDKPLSVQAMFNFKTYNLL